MMRTRLGVPSALCGFFALLGTAAQAQTVGYTLVLSEHPQFAFNAPFFNLTNDSTSATITNLTMTLGDTNFNFDFAAESAYTVGSGTFNLITPDAGDGGIRDSKIVMDFGDFAPTEAFRFSGDIDRTGSGDTVEDARLILFNNGDIANSTFAVTFSTGQELNLTFPDGATNALTYTFQQSAPVPAPQSLAVLGVGFSGVCLSLIRKRRR